MSEDYIKKLEKENFELVKRIFELEQKYRDIMPEVTNGTRKLKAKWTPEAMNDLQNMFGQDILDEISKDFSKMYLSKGINQ